MTKSTRMEIARKLKALRSLNESELQQASGGLSTVESFSTMTLGFPSIDWVRLAVTCGSYNL
jgi:hypothetical protein